MDDLDELAIFGTRIDVCAAEYFRWPALCCNLLAGHEGRFHVFEWYDTEGDVVAGFAWREGWSG